MSGKFWSAKFQTSLLIYVVEHLIVEEEHVLHLTLVLEDWRIIALDGVSSVCLTNYLCSCVIQLYVLFLVSRINWICIYLQGFNNSLDHGDCLRWQTPRDGLADN